MTIQESTRARTEEPGSSVTAVPGRRMLLARQQRQLAGVVIEILAEAYPKTFFRFERRRLPLKVGIDHDVAIATAGAIGVAELKTALRDYTSNLQYIRACCFEGAVRIDLTGAPAGVVTADEAAHARERLARARQRLAARKASTKATNGE